MTEQQIDRERLRHRAGAGYTVFLRPEETTSILDALEQAEARIKAVQDLIDQADVMGEWAVTCTRLQWAVDGSAPQSGA